MKECGVFDEPDAYVDDELEDLLMPRPPMIPLTDKTPEELADMLLRLPPMPLKKDKKK